MSNLPEAGELKGAEGPISGVRPWQEEFVSSRMGKKSHNSQDIGQNNHKVIASVMEQNAPWIKFILFPPGQA